MNAFFKEELTFDQALPKIRAYCAYQERCHAEVKDKLYQLGLNSKESDRMLSQLIEENFLNEERFAAQFAGGKFRMKQWGKVKIKHELQQKQVSQYCINKAFLEIDAGAYYKTLTRLAERKWKSLKEQDFEKPSLRTPKAPKAIPKNKALKSQQENRLTLNRAEIRRQVIKKDPKGQRNILVKKQKTINYLLQKGYESALIKEVVEAISK